LFQREIFFRRCDRRLGGRLVRYAVPVRRSCKVSVVDPSGKRHTLDVEAESVCGAVFRFNSEAVCHPAQGLPKPTDETSFEVEVDGVIHQRTFRQATAWARRSITRLWDTMMACRAKPESWIASSVTAPVGSAKITQTSHAATTAIIPTLAIAGELGFRARYAIKRPATNRQNFGGIPELHMYKGFTAWRSQTTNSR
jgi:hypothetical protein